MNKKQNEFLQSVKANMITGNLSYMWLLPMCLRLSLWRVERISGGSPGSTGTKRLRAAHAVQRNQKLLQINTFISYGTIFYESIKFPPPQRTYGLQ